VKNLRAAGRRKRRENSENAERGSMIRRKEREEGREGITENKLSVWSSERLRESQTDTHTLKYK